MVPSYIPLHDRTILAVEGEEREAFLQGLITNDVKRLRNEPAIYAGLLTPQGKLLFDFLLIAAPDAILLDVEAACADELMKKLALYRLRSKVTLHVRPERIYALEETSPDYAGSFADPRHAGLGARWVSATPPEGTPRPIEEYLYTRYRLGIGEGRSELTPEKTFPTDVGFERLHGVDFAKGCYVGQEVTARMKHRGGTRKAMFTLAFDGPAPAAGTPVTGADGTIGEIRGAMVHPSHGGVAIAQLRLEDVASLSDTLLRAGTADMRLLPQT